MITRLTRRRSSKKERGVSSIAIGIMMPMMIAAMGLSIDVGNLALQQNKTEKAADAAALAIGQDCARASRADATQAQKNKCTTSAAQATAQVMATANGVSGVSAAVEIVNGTATVTVTKDVDMPLGKAVGVQSREAESVSKVSWNTVPVAAETFPLAMSVCDYYDWVDSSDKDKHELYRYDLYQKSVLIPNLFGTSCTTPLGKKNSAQGAMWLPNLGSSLTGECKVGTRIGNVIAGTIIASGITIPSACLNLARNLTIGKVYALPVYSTNSILGLAVSAKIEGYAPFKITGYRIGSLLTAGVEDQDDQAPVCRATFLFWNRCNGIQGHFVGNIGTLDEITEWGAPSGVLDLGIVLPKLIG